MGRKQSPNAHFSRILLASRLGNADNRLSCSERTASWESNWEISDQVSPFYKANFEESRSNMEILLTCMLFLLILLGVFICAFLIFAGFRLTRSRLATGQVQEFDISANEGGFRARVLTSLAALPAVLGILGLCVLIYFFWRYACLALLLTVAGGIGVARPK